MANLKRAMQCTVIFFHKTVNKREVYDTIEVLFRPESGNQRTALEIFFEVIISA